MPQYAAGMYTNRLTRVWEASCDASETRNFGDYEEGDEVTVSVSSDDSILIHHNGQLVKTFDVVGAWTDQWYGIVTAYHLDNYVHVTYTSQH